MTAAPAQGALFELVTPSPLIDPQSLDPFKLPQQNTEFWRWKSIDVGTAALYFVIDYELPLLLYVGETVKSGQRWKGEHDCKRYLLNYRQAHYQHGLSTQLGTAFWAAAPTQTRSRQQMEAALIYKWRSPLNKENWEHYGERLLLEEKGSPIARILGNDRTDSFRSGAWICLNCLSVIAASFTPAILIWFAPCIRVGVESDRCLDYRLQR